MKNVMKATTLESRFPLLAVEHGCIISKDADITAAFEVELPEVYTVTAEEYEGIHATWCKAIKVLPRLAEDGHGLPRTEQRDALQRASVSES